MVAALELLRWPVLFTAVADSWTVLLLQSRTMPAGSDMLLLGACSAGLLLFGMVLNDICDVRYDRRMGLARPIAQEAISLRAAVALCLAAGATAGAAAAVGPARLRLAAAVAGLIVAYNLLSKRIGIWSVLLLGAIRAVHCQIAAVGSEFLIVSLVLFWHVTLVSLLAYRLEGKGSASQISEWLIQAMLIVIMFSTIVLYPRQGGRELQLLLPACAAGAWLITVAAVLRVAGAAHPAGRQGGLDAESVPDTRRRLKKTGHLLVQLGLLWVVVYDALFLLGGGKWRAAAVVGLMLPAAAVAMRLQRRLWNAASAKPVAEGG